MDPSQPVFRGRTTDVQRPAPPRRTLSSSLRQYRHTDFFTSFARPSRAFTDNLDSSNNRGYGTIDEHPASDGEITRAIMVEDGESTQLLNGTTEAVHASPDAASLCEDVDDSDEEAHDTPQADADGLFPPNCTWTSNIPIPTRSDPFGNLKCNVWSRVHEVRREIITAIDDPYSLEQLKAPRMNISVVRPLVDKFFNMHDLCIVYALLTNRVQFIREQSYATHHQTLNLTRALLCELLADRVLRRYNELNPGPIGLLKLSNILVFGFEPFQGAPPEVIRSNARANKSDSKRTFRNENKMTALEIAIVSESKNFLASTACQRVIDAIYRGKVVYSPNSFIDIIPDRWKKRPISLYDPRRGPLLNQYRLIVPRTRNIIEAVQYLVLLVLYIIVMTGRETWKTTKYDVWEAFFDLYAAGWVLDQIASILEHGWNVYTQNLWSFLDVLFTINFISYFVIRMHGLRADTEEAEMRFGRTSLDILSCAAPLLMPRLAFNIMSDNMLILSLRSMMADFLTLTGLAIWCFAGFLFSLKWLHEGAHEPYTIVKWMIWIWFGLDGTGIDQAPDFHWFLGPTLMIAFAFLGNTLFLTILVSMLTNTFSTITSNAVQEIQYRRSVLTFMGVKSDAIFAYMPPFNLVALIFLLPLKWVISPRAFHKLNVVISKLINFPTLLLIGLYERRALWISERLRNNRPRRINWADPNGPRATNGSWWSRPFQPWNFSTFSAHGDIQAVFDAEPPQLPIIQADGASPNRARKASKAIGPLETAGATDDADRAPRPALFQVASHISKKSKKDTIKEEALRKEFCDSEEDIRATEDLPLGYTMSRKKTRRDSIIDFDNPFAGSHETNGRLMKLEQGMERIESLLLQLLDDGTDDNGRTQDELRENMEAERV